MLECEWWLWVRDVLLLLIGERRSGLLYDFDCPTLVSRFGVALRLLCLTGGKILFLH